MSAIGDIAEILAGVGYVGAVECDGLDLGGDLKGKEEEKEEEGCLVESRMPPWRQNLVFQNTFTQTQGHRLKVERTSEVVVRLKEGVAKASGLRSGWMMVKPVRKEDEGIDEGSVNFQVEWDTEAAHGTQKQIEER